MRGHMSTETISYADIESKIIDAAVDNLIQVLKDFGKVALASSTPDYEITIEIKAKRPEEMV
jgi:hypothetical protein